MLLLDKLLVGSVKFVLGKVASAVETELNDDDSLREQLLRAQMMLELGEMTQAEFDDVEAAVLERLREIKARREGAEGMGGGIQLSELAGGDVRVTGIEASFTADDFHDEPAPVREPEPVPAPVRRRKTAVAATSKKPRAKMAVARARRR